MSDQSSILAALGIDDPEPIQVIEYEDDNLTPEERVMLWLEKTNSLFNLVWRLRFGGVEDPIFKDPELVAVFWAKVHDLAEKNGEGSYSYVSWMLGFECDWQTHQHGVNPA